MKIGVLTFFRPLNNGAVLQACATTKIVLKKMGADAELIDFRLQRIETDRALFGKKRILRETDALRRIRRVLADVVRFPMNYRQRKLYDSFIKTHLQTSREIYYTQEDLTQKCQQYDAYLVGSDLVWSPLMAEGVNPVYFLNFVKGNKPKIAYAPSIGTTQLSEEEMEKYKAYLGFLDFVSLREKSSAEQLKSITGYPVEAVLDPTLLTEEKDWQPFYRQEAMVQEPYIFAFSLEQSDLLIDTVHNLAEKAGHRVVVFGRKNKKYKGKNVIFTDSACGPAEFLNLVKHAACVVTNSFHGCAFSVIFHKEFYCIPHSERGIRMIDLLNCLGIGNRIVTSADRLTAEKIDYTVVDEKKQKLSESSLEFLKKALGRENWK